MASDRRDQRPLVDSAIALLDLEGVEGLSMRRLSARMGVSTTSLYWLVASKDEVVALAADEVFGRVDLPVVEERNWRTAACELAHGLRAVILEHPWLALVMASHPTAFGPRMAGYLDRLIAVYESAGFRDDDLDWAVATTFAFIHGMALGEAGEAIWRATVRREGADEQQSMSDLIAMGRRHSAAHPRLMRRFEAQEDVEPGDVRQLSFDFGLGALLDGFESRRDPQYAAGPAPAPRSAHG